MSNQKRWREMEGQRVVPQPMARTQDVLRQLKQALEEMIKKEQVRKAQVQEHLHRMKHGGGA